MKLATKIFRRNDWYVTSKFGYRIHPITKKKKYHYGTDYGTNAQKWKQYALEDGYVYVVHKGNTGYGNYVWVRYPRLNISLMHAHLDSICVKKNQKVKAGTLIGYTGTTGQSTGIHLHLGMTKIGSSKWLDPHSYNYQEPTNKYNLTRLLYKGCKGNDVKELQKKLKISADGVFGNNTKNAVIKFQKANKLTADGKVGKNTAHKLGWLYKNK